MPSNPNFRGVGANPNFRGVGANTEYSPSLFDQIIGGFRMGGQAYGNIFSGRPLMTGMDELEEDIKTGTVRDEKGEIIYQKGKKVPPTPKDPKRPEFDEIFGMPFDKYLDKVAQVGEKAKDRDALRAGISNLAYSPLIGSQAAMDAAANIGQLTGVNMAAIANQSSLMSQNPTKQKIAGKYFR